MNTIFFELTLVLIIAGGIAFVISFFKQPSIIAYIATGLILGPLGYYQLHQGEALSSLSEIGITLLLFMVGLELDVSQMKRIGKTALIAGLCQIIFTTSLGFIILKLLGFTNITSFFVAICLTFSSTIIVVKLLSEKHDLQSLYGKIAIGIFLVQDFAAIILLISLSSLGGGDMVSSGLPTSLNFLLLIVKAIVLALIVIFHSKYIFPKILQHLGGSDELLLVFSLAWALGLATLVSLPVIGFNLEIGGFIAGLALANSAVHYQIGARIKSLRDFFIILFFIVLGSQIALDNVLHLGKPALILSAFVLIGNPLIVLTALGLLGYKPRTAFLSSVTFGQISEFSLILIALAYKLGYVDQSAVGLVTLVGIITIALCSYTILYAEKLFLIFQKPLSWFDFKKGSAEKGLQQHTMKNHIVLLGAHRVGEHIIKTLQKQKTQFLVVDHNPDVAEKYSALGIPVLCGDITDPHIQELAALKTAKLVISTLPDLNDNLMVIDAVAKNKSKTKVIVTAQEESDATILYDRNTDYVILPHFIGGMHIARLLGTGIGFNSHLKALKQNHLKLLRRA